MHDYENDSAKSLDTNSHQGTVMNSQKTSQRKTWEYSQFIQRKNNETGLPDHVKAGVENLSGMDLGHVRVNYNSDKPAQMNAHAYAQGNNIHMAPGQDRHVAHEAWHVVQQAQGRVAPTTQFAGQAINDDQHLENEADVMGAKAETVGRQLV